MSPDRNVPSTAPVPPRPSLRRGCAAWRAAAIAATLIVLTVEPRPVGAASRPNILVILADDMGYSDIGCYGGEIRTPNLDALARGGVRLTQFYNNARCCPTRASLLTGLYPHQAGIGHMTDQRGIPAFSGELGAQCVTIAEALRPAGYRTYMCGKWHVTYNTHPDSPKHAWPLQRGFERFYGTITGAGSYFDPTTLCRDNRFITPQNDPEYRPARFYYTDAITDNAIRFLKDHSAAGAQEPFFLYVAYTAAHWPMHALPEDIERYRGRYDSGYGPVREARLARGRELGVLSPLWSLSPQAERWEDVKDKAWEARCMEVYAAMVDRMDQGIGRILEELRREEKLESTLVVYLQDNGGCAEGMGRKSNADEVAKASLAPFGPDDLQPSIWPPMQTRDGRPVRTGPDVPPGGEDSYIAYGRGWANVSNTPFREYKHWVHEGGISSPLIAHWPEGIPVSRRGAIDDTPAHLIDLFATCVEVAGATPPTEREGARVPPPEGTTLRPLLEGRKLDRGCPIFFEHEANRAVRDGRWKLVAKGPAGAWELHDMQADRCELEDVGASRPELVRELSRQWETWAKRVGALPWIWKPPYGEREK